MQHSLHVEGFGLCLRPVSMADAEFIVSLRNQDYVKGWVGDSATDVISQQKWLEKYFERAGDCYFIIETPGGLPLGTGALYEIAGNRAEWGRFIMRPEVPAALPAAVLFFNLAFEQLGLRELLARCVSTNLIMRSLVKKWGFRQTETKPAGQIIGGRPVDIVHFVLAAGKWIECRRHLLGLSEFAGTQIEKWEKQMDATRTADQVTY